MAKEIVSERPCRYYCSIPVSIPISKSQGICLILKWAVSNFMRIPMRDVIEFPRLRPTPQCDIEVSFCKKDETLYLYVENEFESDIRFDATTIISDKDGKLLHHETVKDGWLKGKRNILPALKNRDCLSNLMVFEIKLDLYKLSCEIWDMSAWEREEEVKLAEDMKKLILSELPANVVLKTKDDDIPANRAILQARSPVFKKMFDHALSERDSDAVSIEEVSGATMRNLVHFLYSGKADLLETELESLKELYYAADKYEVWNLREICAQTMIPLLTKENAISVLVMANLHSDENLKMECLRSIRSSGFIDAIMETDDWTHLKASDPSLAFEVLETCVKGTKNDKQQ